MLLPEGTRDKQQDEEGGRKLGLLKCQQQEVRSLTVGGNKINPAGSPEDTDRRTGSDTGKIFH